MDAQSSDKERSDRLRLGTSIRAVQFLCMQAIEYSGYDELSSYHNSDAFVELIKLKASLNPKINDVVLENAPEDAQYISPEFQKEVLHIFAERVKNKIRDEIGEANFCVVFGEVKDITYKDQLAVAIVLRFVDVNGFLRERFFDVVVVDDDANAETLKKAISDALRPYHLDIGNMRGQTFDGEESRRKVWKDLTVLLAREYPYAYYVHGFVYRLELALVTAFKNDGVVWLFFETINGFINLITDPITLGQLQSAKANEIANMVVTGEKDTNQPGNSRKAGNIDWTCHFESICCIIDKFIPVVDLLECIEKECRDNDICGNAYRCSIEMWSFEFMFILHMMHRIMLITEFLCKAFQHKNLDIPNTMDCVRNTKKMLQDLRKDGFEDVLLHVKSVCSVHGIKIPNMNNPSGSDRVHIWPGKKDIITEEQRYQNLFNTTIDSQLEELNNRFSDEAMELLRLASALEPKDNFKSFDADHIYDLAKKFYPDDFSELDMHYLWNQLQDYKLNIVHDMWFQGMTTTPELCRGLVETNKAHQYNMIDRLICLVLTLPVSTPATERAVSALKDVKTVICDRRGQEEYLTDSMVPYIEREIAESIKVDSIIDEVYSKRNSKVGLGP